MQTEWLRNTPKLKRENFRNPGVHLSSTICRQNVFRWAYPSLEIERNRGHTSTAQIGRHIRHSPDRGVMGLLKWCTANRQKKQHLSPVDAKDFQFMVTFASNPPDRTAGP